MNIVYKHALYPNTRELTINTTGCKNISSTENGITFDWNVNITKGDKIEYSILEDSNNPSSKEFSSYIVYNHHTVYPDKIVIKEEELTDTSKYLIPLIEETRDTLMYDSYFFNAYIDNDKGYPMGDYFLFITYRYFPFEYYHNMESRLKRCKEFIYKFDNSDKRFVTFVFNLEKFKDIYDKFIDSNFMNWGESIINTIKKFHNLKDSDIEMLVLNNDPLYRKYLEESLNFEYTYPFGRKKQSNVMIPENMSLRSKINLNNETLKL